METEQSRIASEIIGVAAVIGIPVGLGIALAVHRVTGGASPVVAVLGGTVAAGILMVAVILLGVVGSIDPEFA